MSAERDRLERVARACAAMRYVLETNPAPRDIDYDEARRFIAMMSAYDRSPLPPSYWERQLDQAIDDIAGES